MHYTKITAMQEMLLRVASFALPTNRLLQIDPKLHAQIASLAA